MLHPKLFFIPTKKQIKCIEDLFYKHFGAQMRDVWNLGLCTGLRLNELLILRFADFDIDTLELTICEAKKMKISMSNEALAIILKIRRQHPTDEFIFQSRRSRNVINIEPKPISNQAIHKAFKDVAGILNEKFSPRTMRQIAAIYLITADYSHDCINNPELSSEILKCHLSSK